MRKVSHKEVKQLVGHKFGKLIQMLLFSEGVNIGV
jgi:hypothetical protein